MLLFESWIGRSDPSECARMERLIVMAGMSPEVVLMAWLLERKAQFSGQSCSGHNH